MNILQQLRLANLPVLVCRMVKSKVTRQTYVDTAKTNTHLNGLNAHLLGNQGRAVLNRYGWKNATYYLTSNFTYKSEELIIQ